jgi:hypothetical protein
LVPAIQRAGHTTIVDPLPFNDAGDAAGKYIQAAAAAGITYAAVGALSNPIYVDPVKATEAIALCQQAFQRVERLGPR